MHSPFPWRTHPQMPTCVYNADGMKISEAIGPDAEDNAALIAAIPAMVEALQQFAKVAEHISDKSRDNRPLIFALENVHAASITVGDIRRVVAVLASIGKTATAK